VAVLFVAASAVAQAPADEATLAGDRPAAVRMPLALENAAQGFHSTFTAEGVRVAPLAEPEAALVALRLIGWGRAGNLSAPEPADVVIEGARIAYRRGPLVEWFVNGPAGLEQGFTISTAPVAGDTAAPIELRLELGGTLSPRLLPDGSGLLLVDDGGVARLSYTKLAAWDAEGRQLAARLELNGDTLSIVVADSGTSYPLTIDPLLGTEEFKLLPSDPPAEFFGYDVALSGDTAVVGARADSPGGSAYVYLRSGTSWSQQAKLTASADETFGTSVAIEADTLLIGAENDTDFGLFSGSAYVFVRSGTSWSQQAKLNALDEGIDDYFGHAVALSGETALVAAINEGAAYVFVRSGTSWSQQAKLVASDAVPIGDAVSLSGDTAVVGAQWTAEGAAYVFVRSGTSWSEQAKLTAADGSFSDRFGSDVAVEGDTIVVGAPRDDEPDWVSDNGSAYVFVRSGTSWTQQAKLAAWDPFESTGGDWMGASVALSGDRAIVGASTASVTGAGGAVYVFGRTGTTWTQETIITGSDVGFLDEFGSSVDLEGDRTVVGAYNNLAAYVHRLTGDDAPWTNLGFGLGGTTLPRLTGTGTLAAGSSGSLALASAPPFSLAALFISFIGASAPFKGGTLVPVPFAMHISLFTNAAGKITLPWPSFPAGLPAGTNLYFQYALQDGMAPAGVALSNAVKGTTP